MVKYLLLSAFSFFAVFIFFSILVVSPVHAQVCGGTFDCHTTVTSCSCSFTGNSCTQGSPSSCAGGLEGTCDCTNSPVTQTHTCSPMPDAISCALNQSCGGLQYTISPNCAWTSGGGGGGGGGGGCVTDNDCPGCLGCSAGVCNQQVNAYCNTTCGTGGTCLASGACSCPAATPTPALPACPENQSGANTIQCQGSCVAGWSPLGGYSCSGGGQCCQKDPATPTPTPCPYGAGVTGYKTYCSGNNLRENYNRNESGICGNSDNLIQVCTSSCVTDSPTAAHCASSATSTPTTAVCRNLGQSCGVSAGSCCGTNVCNGGVCAVPTGTPTTGGTSTVTTTKTSTPPPTATQPPVCTPTDYCLDSQTSCHTTVACTTSCSACPVNWTCVGYCQPPHRIWVTIAKDTNNNGTYEPAIDEVGTIGADVFIGSFFKHIVGTDTFDECGPSLIANAPSGYYVAYPSGGTYSPTSCGSGYVFLMRILPTPTINAGLLNGSIFLDTNRDGVKQGGETNLTGGSPIQFSFQGTFDEGSIEFYCPPPSLDTTTGTYTFNNQTNQYCYNNGLSAIRFIIAPHINNYGYTKGGLPADTDTRSLTFSSPTTPNSVANPNPIDFGVAPSVSITGLLTGSTGTSASTPPAGSNVTVLGPAEGGSTSQNQAGPSFNFSPLWGGTYTITASNTTGYVIQYKCNNGNCATTGTGDVDYIPGTYYNGNVMTKKLPSAGQTVDVVFKYAVAPRPPTPCAVTGLGDIDNDGFVTSNDVTLAQQIVIGIPGFTATQIQRADVNGVNGVTSADTVLIMRYMNGLDTTFPACNTTPATATLTQPPACPGNQTVSGVVLVDTAGNLCASGSTPYTVATQVQFTRSAGTLTTNTNGSGAYSFADTAACTEANKTLTLQLASPYTVSAVQMVAGGPWIANPSYTSPTFDQTSPRIVNWCITSGGPWFQVNTGDVRYPRISNPIPSNNAASTGTNKDASLFYSSSSAPNFNGRPVSIPNWTVPQEYNYNSDFKNGLGSMSYSYFVNHVKQKNIQTNTITSPVNAFSLTSGVYTYNGNLTIWNNSANYVVQSGQHIIILVNGNVTISNKIIVPNGTNNLFVVAAKGNITIDPTIGVAANVTPDVTVPATRALDGYYTAEGDITIPSVANCATPVADQRLNVSGALIANSLHPFATDPTGGKINNSRTLCSSGNLSNPVLSVYSRPEFLTQLTDFYRFTYRTVKEVAP